MWRDTVKFHMKTFECALRAKPGYIWVRCNKRGKGGSMSRPQSPPLFVILAGLFVLYWIFS